MECDELSLHFLFIFCLEMLHFWQPKRAWFTWNHAQHKKDEKMWWFIGIVHEWAKNCPKLPPKFIIYWQCVLRASFNYFDRILLAHVRPHNSVGDGHTDRPRESMLFCINCDFLWWLPPKGLLNILHHFTVLTMWGLNNWSQYIVNWSYLVLIRSILNCSLWLSM